MTISDILTVLGAGAGAVLLLGMAAAPLLADLSPNPTRPARSGAAELPTPPPSPGTILADSAAPAVPAPRGPADGPAGVAAQAPPAGVRA